MLSNILTNNLRVTTEYTQTKFTKAVPIYEHVLIDNSARFNELYPEELKQFVYTHNYIPVREQS